MLLSKFGALSPFQRSSLSALAALLFYGGWAYLVNSMHGPMAATKAALVQGSYSMVLTFVMAVMVETIYWYFGKLFKHLNAQIWATIVLSCAVVFSTSWGVNAWAGTPEIFNTVILGYVIGAIYTTLYVYGLARPAPVSEAG
ncbi:MAG: hypothetical protein HKN50_03420 [Gammaproteobacteria bacterium]|nr:hypothetical protein [Gammaproteobacteria bacterium]